MLITTAAKANFSLFIVVKYSFRKGLLQKRLSNLKAFFVNLQGNFETNTQLGLRNQFKDDELKARLPVIFKEIYTRLHE